MAGGLTFNDYSSDYLNNNKSSFRKAGEVFSNVENSTVNNSSIGSPSNNGGSAYSAWMDAMANQSINDNNYATQTNTQNQVTSSSGSVDQPIQSTPSPAPAPTSATAAQPSGPTMKPPKSGKYYADYDEVKAAWDATYDEDKYRYYESKSGSGTGADAYHTDMAKYQAQMLTMGDNPHLGLVNSMMHPDWQDHNYNGTYGKINKEADYSTMPTGAAYGPGGKKQGIFGGGKSSAVGSPKGGYDLMKSDRWAMN